MFNVDRPIEFDHQDTLHFLPFAAGLGRALANQRFGEGLVIAVNGKWGSGKTSVSNLAIREMWKIESEEQAKADKEKTIVYRFEPWTYTGHSNLIVEFFAGLAEVLEKPLGYDISQAIRNLASGIYRRRSETLGAAAIAVDAAGGSGAAVAALAAGKEISKRVPASLARDNLQEQRDRLKELLRRQGRRVVVLIDDLDRIDDRSARLLIGVLKSIADLPGVTYLLPMDVELVSAALQAENVSGGVRYLEKVVQVSVDMPTADIQSMARFFDASLSQLLADDDEAVWETSDWDYIAGAILRGYLRTPRQVNRLVNRLRVSWPSLRGEVYFPDLLGIEAFREFEPSAYTLIKEHPSELFMGLESGFNSSEFRDFHAKLVESFSDSTKEAGKGLFSALFPAGRRRISRAFGQRMRGRAIADEVGFDAYFRWTLPADAAEVRELRRIQELLRSGGSVIADVANLAAKIGPNGNRASRHLLDEIISGKLTDLPSSTSLLRAVLVAAEQIVDVPPDADWLVSSEGKIGSAIRQMLIALEPGKRVEHTEKLIADVAIPLYGGAKLVDQVEEAKSDPASEFNDESVRPMIKVWFAHLKGRQAELRATDRSGDVIDVVRRYVGTSEARTLVEDNIDEARVVESIALGLMSKVNSSESSRVFRRLSRTPDSDVYDLALLANAIDSFVRSGSLQVTDALTEFTSKAKLILKGKYKPEADRYS